MKALVQDIYGTSDVLRVDEVDPPAAGRRGGARTDRSRVGQRRGLAHHAR